MCFTQVNETWLPFLMNSPRNFLPTCWKVPIVTSSKDYKRLLRWLPCENFDDFKHSQPFVFVAVENKNVSFPQLPNSESTNERAAQCNKFISLLRALIITRKLLSFATFTTFRFNNNSDESSERLLSKKRLSRGKSFHPKNCLLDDDETDFMLGMETRVWLAR